MHIRSLYLKNFRLFKEKEFRFGPQMNVISGPNARGKTTVLEAIQLLITGRSFRTAQLKDLIRHGETDFLIDLSFVKHGVDQNLRMWFNGKEKKIVHNHTSCHGLSSLLGILVGTIMIPDDIDLVKGAPLKRRRYLDIQLAQTDPLYVHHLRRYQKALINRNILLKNKAEKTIEVWEHELTKSAGYIVKQRFQAVKELQVNAKLLMQQLSKSNEQIRLEYKGCQFAQMEDSLALFKKMRKKEMHLGSTLIGPHREDMAIRIGNFEAKHFASQGQLRSLAAALRLAEWQRLAIGSDERPLMLIDDIGISLDEERKSLLLTQLSKLNQVFLTGTEVKTFPNTAEIKL